MIRRPVSPLALRGSLGDPEEGVRQSLARLYIKLAGQGLDEQFDILHETALAELYYVQSAGRFMRDCTKGKILVTEGLASAVMLRREQANAKLSTIVYRMDVLEHDILERDGVLEGHLAANISVPSFAQTLFEQRLAALSEQLNDERTTRKHRKLHFESDTDNHQVEPDMSPAT
ncbi:hypothetical protein BD626DRAFT_567822 [Schizophyllum amplum]|uniref:Uncharacterized protein n=1 Tax=Schizophyllum amplum TaxID=97359 RepID=A0A550CJM2_9AGAR|nr:hypothetical protein BD626DRAFT_567822 [Auriculariopsis ampla]